MQIVNGPVGPDYTPQELANVTRRHGCRKAADRIPLSQQLRRVFRCLLVMLPSLISQRTLALQPPRPGEVQHLKQTGEWAERFDKAQALGNHLIDPDRLQRALSKAQRQAL